MPSCLRAPLLFAALLGVGCSAPVVDDVADATGGMTEGVFVIERVVSGDGAPLTNVSAKFIHLGATANSELAERLVGSRLDLPAEDECIAIAPGASAPAATLAALGPIELIDVGDVNLHTRGSSMPLAARAFPDIGDLVSGVFYTSRDAANDLPVDASYVLEGTGSAQIDRFAIEVDAPAALEGVRIGDAALADGVTLEEGAPVTIRWGAPRAQRTAQSERGDVIMVEIGARGGAIRCAFADDGEAVLPASVLGRDALGERTQAATIGVHRIRQRSFGAAGFDTGEIRFDLAVVGRATIGPRAQ